MGRERKGRTNSQNQERTSAKMRVGREKTKDKHGGWLENSRVRDTITLERAGLVHGGWGEKVGTERDPSAGLI